MSSTAVATVIKMLEPLPEETQERVVEHLREYLTDLQDERAWDKTFERTQDQLMAAARCAKKQIAEGCSTPMDYEKHGNLVLDWRTRRI